MTENAADDPAMLIENIKRRSEMLQAVNQAALLLLSAKEDEDIKIPIQAGLELAGRSANADRVSIWKYDADDRSVNFTNCYCWLNENGIQKAADYPFTENPELINKLMRGESLIGPVSKMNRGDSAFFSRFDVESIVIIPLFLDDKFWGLFSLEDCGGNGLRREGNGLRRGRDFSEEETAVLKSFCLMISSAFSRSASITKRTHELGLQTATLAALFNTIPDLIFTKDLDLRYMQCNKAFLEYFGRSPEEIIGKDDVEALGKPVKTAEAFNNMDRMVIRDNKTIVIEDPIQHVDGKILLFETTKTPLMIDGEAAGIMGIAHNITRRKERESEMAANYMYAGKLSSALADITKSPAIYAGDLKAAADVISEKGCLALNTHRIGIWMYAGSLDEEEENNILENIACYNAESKNHIILDDFNLADRQEYMKLLKSERLIVMNNADECRLISCSNADDKLFAALDAPIFIGGRLAGVVCSEQFKNEFFPDGRQWMTAEQNFVSSLADLMALALAGSELHNARDEAETASRTKSSFLANMSHEIRTPMNAILGVVEILIESKIIPAEIEEGLDTIYNSCDLLLGIINDILDFSKIEAGKMDIIPDQYKIANLISDSVQISIMKINSKPIVFELEVDENIPANLIGDELRIKQILNNLLSNAFKYTDAGKVTLSVRSESLPGSSRIMLVLSVRDTGSGMTKEQLGRLFEEYSRFDLNKNITVEGTGLGLAITDRLVKLMNGSLHVESEPGAGSYFDVRLPQISAGDDALGRDAAENLKQMRNNYLTRKKRNGVSRDPMPYGSVLIVDDVETNLYVAVGLMKLYRLQIETAMSGLEAIEKVKEGKIYDIIFMDHMMPEMDGIEAVKRLRGSGYKAPIVALTANAVVGQAEVFLENGFDEFISKPIDIRQLNLALNKFIRDKQPPDVIEAARRQKVELKSNTGISRDPLLIKSFIRDARKAEASLEELLVKNEFENEDNLRKFTIMVHGIKNSLWIIGETELGEAAHKLETAGREKDVDMIKTSAPEFLNQIRSLLEKIDLKEEDGKSAKSAQEDEEDLRDKLLDIKSMCADYNKKGALEIISQIKKCSGKTKAVLENITEYMLHSEFEEAEKAASNYAADLLLAGSKTAMQLLKREVPGLEISKGLQWYEGDADTYLKVLRLFAVSVRAMLDSIETVSEDKLDFYKIKVHGIKGTSLDIYALEVGKEAANLEEAAKAANWDYISKNHPVFLKIARKLIDDLEKMLAELDAENPKPKKELPDDRFLLRLLAACKNNDIDAADEAMEEIDKFQYLADDGLAAWLRENMDLMNIRQIAEKLSGMYNI